MSFSLLAADKPLPALPIPPALRRSNRHMIAATKFGSTKAPMMVIRYTQALSVLRDSRHRFTI